MFICQHFCEFSKDKAHSPFNIHYIFRFYLNHPQQGFPYDIILWEFTDLSKVNKLKRYPKESFPYSCVLFIDRCLFIFA